MKKTFLVKMIFQGDLTRARTKLQAASPMELAPAMPKTLIMGPATAGSTVTSSTGMDTAPVKSVTSGGSRKDLDCWHCGKKGHVIADWRSRKG